MLRSFLADLTKHIPPGQLGRYLLVGICNTAFAYGSYALFTALLDRHISRRMARGALPFWQPDHAGGARPHVV